MHDGSYPAEKVKDNWQSLGSVAAKLVRRALENQEEAKNVGRTPQA